MEVLIIGANRGDTQRGDIIDARPDGFEWGVEEIADPIFRIVHIDTPLTPEEFMSIHGAPLERQVPAPGALDALVWERLARSRSKIRAGQLWQRKIGRDGVEETSQGALPYTPLAEADVAQRLNPKDRARYEARPRGVVF